jgi:hypothetical protein
MKINKLIKYLIIDIIPKYTKSGFPISTKFIALSINHFDDDKNFLKIIENELNLIILVIYFF